jgi:hypothetical protein
LKRASSEEEVMRAFEAMLRKKQGKKSLGGTYNRMSYGGGMLSNARNQGGSKESNKLEQSSLSNPQGKESIDSKTKFTAAQKR